MTSPSNQSSARRVSESLKSSNEKRFERKSRFPSGFSNFIQDNLDYNNNTKTEKGEKGPEKNENLFTETL